ncbi:MAG: SDR family oxidoreductase [Isosphaeraceae bacterium]|nr:SDR family oxidoreductase [Isosphaeraceae bacterium]
MSESSKRVVITGATRGLGRALTEGLIARGHVVLGCGRSGPDIAALASRFSSPHRFDVVDVAKDAAVAAWAESVILEGGPPDLLVNNAAVMNRPASLWEIDATEFDSLVDVNIKGIANVIRHFVPSMVAAGRGVVVNLSSGWGRSTSPGVAPYCATKWAVEGLTAALAQELPKGVAAVALNPGIIDTEMLRTCWSDDAGRFPKAEVWARSAVPFFLGLGPRDNGRALTVPGS